MTHKIASAKKSKIATVIQAGSDPFDTPATIQKFADLLCDAKSANSDIAVFPEAFIGGYPKGVDFGARIGSRSDAGRDLYRRYADNAVELDSPIFDALANAVAANDVITVVGVIEKRGGTLYCSTFNFERDGSLLGVHRKLMPTAMERLIWGFGDGSDLPIMDSSAGRLVSAICWENYMPHLRSYYYDAQPDFYCVSTVDDRDVWIPSMQMIALEGRNFVLSSCQYLERGMIGLDESEFDAVQGNAPDTVLINGGSCIINPMGEIIGEPLYGKEGMVSAQIDPDMRTRGQFDLDVSGHYARTDIFALGINIEEQKNVHRD